MEQRQETRSIPRADSLSREELVRAGARDPEALGRFFDFYVDRVFALAYRLLGDRTIAEDVSQEVFLKIHRAIDRVDPERDPGPWVTTITYNACREHWRSSSHKMARKTVPLEGIAGGSAALASRGASPEGDVLRAEREARVQGALMRLPDNLREVVVLHDWKDLTHREIADVVGATHAAVRKRYSRALAALAELLREEP